MKAARKFIQIGNRRLAVLNSRSRDKTDDVIISRELNPEERTTFERLKSEDRSDSEIYRLLFPEKRATQQRVYVPIEILNKRQLVELINSRTDEPLKSLKRLSLDTFSQYLLHHTRMGYIFVIQSLARQINQRATFPPLKGIYQISQFFNILFGKAKWSFQQPSN